MTPAGVNPEAPEVAVAGFSLPRPLAGAVVRGPCRVLNLASVPVLPADGLLVVIHAQARFDSISALELAWPECPRAERDHPTGLVGVGLLQRVEWLAAAGSSLDEDPFAVGPWCAVLTDVVAFSKPIECLGYPGFFPLGALGDRIARVWDGRPR